MKKTLLLLPFLPLLLCAGCNTMTFSRTEVTATSTNTVTARNYRFFWASQSYRCTINTNGTATLTASKSTVDSVALGAVAEGAAYGATRIK